jgi:hypothetical protein
MPPPDLIVGTPLSTGASVETLRRSIEALVADRQRLRDEGAGPATLEANRREIVRHQWQLTAALLAARAA